MNKMPRVPNKNQKGLMTDSEKGGQPVRSGYPSWVIGIACLALALGCVGSVKLATAHSGFDPEIHEITEELEKEPNRVDLWIQRGQVYRSYGQFAESLQDLEKAWSLDPNNKRVALERSFTLSSMGRDKEAEVL